MQETPSRLGGEAGRRGGWGYGEAGRRREGAGEPRHLRDENNSRLANDSSIPAISEQKIMTISGVMRQSVGGVPIVYRRVAYNQVGSCCLLTKELQCAVPPSPGK